jgi:hypothetical protein
MDLMELAGKANPLHVLYMTQAGNADMDHQLKNNHEQIEQIVQSTDYLRSNWSGHESHRNTIQEYNPKCPMIKMYS